MTFDSSFSEDVYLIKLKGSGDISASISFLDKEKPSREVNGAAADGVSKVTIQITNLPENITSEKDVLTSINDGDGFLDNDKQISNGVFTQTYIAPEFL